MRITNSMLIKNMLWNANNNLVSMSDYQNQLSSGKKITRPSDDPVGITKVMKYKTDIRETQQYAKNIDDALGWLEVSESSITNIKDILQRVRELTVQAANGTNTPGDTDKMRVEIEQLTSEIMVSGNATSAGRYLFSGLETNKKLFNDDGTFAIDMTSERSNLKHVMGYEVSVGEVMSVGVHPKDLFGIVSNNNFFEGLITRSSGETTKATQATLKATVDLNHDFTAPGNTLEFTVGALTFDVDETLLDNSAVNPLTKDRFVDVLKNTLSGTTPLSDVANIYYDSSDKLVIQAKTYGAGVTLTNASVSAGFVADPVVPGIDGSSVTLSGSAPVTDAMVAAAAAAGESHTLVLQFDGIRKNVAIDFTGLATVADLESAMQIQIDTAFPPAGTINVDTALGTIDLSIGGINDGASHKLSVDYLVSSQSEMVSDLQALAAALATKDDTVIQASLGKLDLHLDRVLTVMGEIGGKNNRVEFIKSRVDENEITFTSLLSKVQDVDMAEAIMYFKNLENVYRASLSVGSKVIQPSLVDFIR